MSVKENKALMRHVFEEMNKGKAAFMAVMDEVYAADYVAHGGATGDLHGLKDFKTHIGALYDACPDLHFTVDDIIAEGDNVAMRWTLTGTLKGALMAIPPTNKKITYWAIEIVRTADGNIMESWERTDTLSMMQQLGLVPIPGKEK